MKKFVFILFYSCVLIKANTQSNYLDSLNTLLRRETSDTGRISILSNMSKYYFVRLNKKDTAILVTRQALLQAAQKHLTNWQLKMLVQLGDQFNYHEKTDSARIVYRQALSMAMEMGQKEDQVLILDGLAAASRDINKDSAVFWTDKAIDVARTNHLLRSELNVLNNAMNIQSKTYIKDSILQFLNRSLEICGLLKNANDSAVSLLMFAIAADDAGNYPVALQKYLQSLAIFRQQKDSFSLASTLLLIGNLYDDQQNYRQALIYEYNAKEVAARPDQLKYRHACLALALTYSNLPQRDSARVYARKAYEYTMKYSHFIPAPLLDDLGLIYYNIGDDSMALVYLRQSYLPLVEDGDDANICEAALGLAQVFKRTGNSDSSMYYARQALRVAQQSGKLKYISDASGLLTAYFKKRKLIDSAFFYQEIGIAAYDSLYNREKISRFQNLSFAEQQRQADIASAEKLAESRYRSNMKIYALGAVLFIFLLVTFILIRNNNQRRKAYDLLQKQKKEIDLQKEKVEKTLDELKETQEQLIHSEKMASLGELTAGIAHEIQNPLNFVNNFSEVNRELADELKSELATGNMHPDSYREAKEIADAIKENSDKISHHGKRADAIVKSMLQHSRTSSGKKEPTDINALADEYLRLAYHGFRAKDKSFNARFEVDLDKTIGKINIVAQDIGRVLLNLINNAFYAVAEKKQQLDGSYEPTLSVSTRKLQDKVEVKVKDNGNGIPQKVLDKIFQPFFTTKPTGVGTGLGLSLSYDIVKAHGGNLRVENREGGGATFVIEIPFTQQT